jgi:hypothetical protein
MAKVQKIKKKDVLTGDRWKGLAVIPEEEEDMYYKHIMHTFRKNS